MTLPNFMIIGVAKAGTTSFYRYLDSIGISFLGVYLGRIIRVRFANEEGE